MRGLIIKDLLNLKKQGIFLGAFVIVYLFISIQMGDGAFFAGVLLIMCALMPMTAMSYDERVKWDRYALSMPISRADIVVGKYALGILLLAVALVASLLATFVVGDINFKDNMLSTIMIGGIGIAMMSVILPILFKVGVEKARYVIIAVFTAPVLAIFTLGKLVDNGRITISQLGQINYTLLAAGVIVALIALFVLSLLISLKIYSRKEF